MIQNHVKKVRHCSAGNIYYTVIIRTKKQNYFQDDEGSEVDHRSAVLTLDFDIKCCPGGHVEWAGD